MTTENQSSSAAFTAPTKAEIDEFKPVIQSNLIPDEATQKKITAAWTALTVPASDVNKVALDMVNYMFDSGTSKAMTFTGNAAGGSVSRQALAGAITNSGATPRQFARLFAKIIWSKRRASDKPPANWSALGVPKELAFAACSFMDGVENEAAFENPGGTLKPPTKEEWIAYEAAKAKGIFDAASNMSRAANTNIQFTGGRLSSSSPNQQYLSYVEAPE